MYRGVINEKSMFNGFLFQSLGEGSLGFNIVNNEEEDTNNE